MYARMNKVNSCSSLKTLPGHDHWRKPSLSLQCGFHGSLGVTFIPCPTVGDWAYSPHWYLSIYLSCLSPPHHISPLWRRRVCYDLESEAVGTRVNLLPKRKPMGQPELYRACELVLMVTFKLDVIYSILFII